MHLKKIVMVIGILWIPLIVWAQNESVRDISASIRDEYFQGHYEKVVQHYERLLEHVDRESMDISTEIYENVIISYFNLEQNDNAESAVRELLRIEPDYQPNSVRIPKDVKPFITEIMNQRGKFIIDSDPEGLWVYIDGKKRQEKTPHSYPVFPGRHEVRVESPDPKTYGDWTDTIDIREREEKIIQADLLKISKLRINTKPADCLVYIDGDQQSERTPNTYTVLAGQHRIRITSPKSKKYKEWEDSVNLLKGEERTLPIELKKRGIPTWVWIAGGGAVIGGGTAAYFYFIDQDNGSNALPEPPDVPNR